MKRLSVSLILFVALALMFPHRTWAVQAYPNPVTVTQPDGTTLTIQLHGDEYLHWTTCNGRLVTCAPDGYYYYAQFTPEGDVQATSGRVTTGVFSSLVQASVVRPPQVAIDRAIELRSQNKFKVSEATRATTKATARDPYLVFMVQFSDVSFQTDQNDFDELLNAENYTYNDATGSVKQYFSDNSNGVFVPEFVVFPPVTIAYASTYFGDRTDKSFDRAVEMFTAALNLVDTEQNVNFAQYDKDGDGYIENIFFYFAGHCQAQGAARTIWPHSWGVTLKTLDGKVLRNYGCASEFLGKSGTNRDGIGTFCHEFGHTLGLEDLYDTDDDDNGSAAGLGSYSLMAGGNYNNNSRTPPYLNCMERNTLGWMEAPQQLTTSGEYSLPPISQNKAYVTPTGNPGETFLYENRQRIGWDAHLPGQGLLIYHSDRSENRVGGFTAAQLWPSNAYASHQCFDLVEAVYPESAVTLSSQIPFPGSSGNTSFTSESSPAARSWSGEATGNDFTNIAVDGENVTFTFTISNTLHLSGRVYTKDAALISGATVTLTAATEVSGVGTKGHDGLQAAVLRPSETAPATYTTQTNSDGVYDLTVPYGTYTMQVSKEGYHNYVGTVSNIYGEKIINCTLYGLLEPVPYELKKYQGVGNYSWGSGDDNVQSNVEGAVGFTSEQLAAYSDYTLTHISYMCAGGGSASETGVAVYVENAGRMECVFTQKMEQPVLGSLATVDVRSHNFKIPTGKLVYFAFYIRGNTNGFPYVVSANESVDRQACLFSYDKGKNWYYATEFGNMIVSAQIESDNSDAITLLGYHNILKPQATYAVGEKLTLAISDTSDNPTSVSWTVNGVAMEGGAEYTFAASGTYIIKAVLTYADRTESITQEIVIP